MVWADHKTELASLPYGGPIGEAFGKFMAFYNRRLVKLAKQRKANGTFGRKNVDHQFIFRDSFQPSFAVRNLIFDGLKAWLKLEISDCFSARPKRTALPVSNPVPLPVEPVPAVPAS